MANEQSVVVPAGNGGRRSRQRWFMLASLTSLLLLTLATLLPAVVVQTQRQPTYQLLAGLTPPLFGADGPAALAAAPANRVFDALSRLPCDPTRARFDMLAAYLSQQPASAGRADCALAATDTVGLFLAGMVAEQQGRQQDALDFWRRAHAKEYFLAVGRTLYDQGDYAAAAEAFGKAVELDPEQASPYEWLALALYRAQDSAGAYATIQTGITKTEASAEAYLLLGDLSMYYLKDPATAVDVLNTGLARYPDNLALSVRLGEAYLRTGSIQLAGELAERAIAADPNYEAGHQLLRSAQNAGYQAQ